MQNHASKSENACQSQLHRASWKSALRSVLGAAWRLHHYRDVRTRMFRDALCDVDCAFWGSQQEDGQRHE